MSKFTPDPGTLFYADSNRVATRQVGQGFAAVVVKEVDRSYDQGVLRCVAVDARVVIADIVWGTSFSTKRRMLLRSEFSFQPLGPEVVKALKLDEYEKPEEI